MKQTVYGNTGLPIRVEVDKIDERWAYGVMDGPYATQQTVVSVPVDDSFHTTSRGQAINGIECTALITLTLLFAYLYHKFLS